MRVCVRVCEPSVAVRGLTLDTGDGAAAEGLGPPGLFTMDRARGGWVGGVGAAPPAAGPGPPRPRFWDGAGARGAASRAGEGATVFRGGWWSSPLGLV